MKDKYRKSFAGRGKQIVILLGLSVVAMLCSIWNTAGIRRDLATSTQEYCAGIIEQMTEAVSDAISNKKTDLINMADSISKAYVNSQEAGLSEFFERKANILDFSAILMIDSEGNCIAKAMEEEIDLAVEAIAAFPGVEDSFQGQVSMGFFDDQKLLYSVPVWVGKEVRYVLVGIRSQEKMQSLLASKSFHGRTFSCIIDSAGAVVLSPVDAESFNYLADLFMSNSQKQVSADIQKMQKDIIEGAEGVFSFIDVKGNRNFLAYHSLELNDWTMLTIVPSDLLASSIDQHTVRSLLIIGGITLLFLLFMMIIQRIYADSRDKLTRLAFVDGMTDGMNDMAFKLKYTQEIKEQRRFPCAIVLLDVKNFKQINEKFDYATGNRVLRHIYHMIIRNLDSSKCEFAARSEMDHFFFCMREGSRERIQARIDAMIDAINDSMSTSDLKCQMEFSQACCQVEGPELEIDALQDRVRVATKKENTVGPGKCVFYDEKLAEKVKREQELDAAFEEALVNHDFKVYLQPKVNLETNEPEGAEALVRWEHPERGLISPAEFIPLFERNGKICRLDFYVFEQVCKFYEERSEKGKRWYPVSVNLSRYHFYREDFLDPFYELYRQYEMPRNSIEFELTESMFFDEEHIGCIKEGIRQMHEMGFCCSMDDFGFGYSSLGLLKEFDVDTLKLDRSFFLDMSSQKAKDIIQSVVELAAKLHVETVAEGIEKPEQMDFLQSINCSTVQGFIFSRPLPLAEFEVWVSQYETR